VTESATQALANAEGLCKVMVKAHVRSPPNSKLISLYLFDAVARHAQEIVRRHGVGFISNIPSSELATNASTFLRALQDPAVQVGIDSLKNTPEEQREKVRKVIDIWDRAGTFSAKILQQIRDQTTSPSGASSQPVEDRGHVAPTSSGLPANVLELLGQVSQRQQGSLTTPVGPSAKDTPPSAPSSRRSEMSHPAFPQGGSFHDRNSFSSPEAPASSSDIEAKNDLRAFDQASFDPTNSEHWERLSYLWKNTYKARCIYIYSLCI